MKKENFGRVYEQLADVSIISTGVETTLLALGSARAGSFLALPAGIARAGMVLELEAHGWVSYDNATTPAIRFKWKLGSLVIQQFVHAATGTATLEWTLRSRLVIRDATASGKAMPAGTLMMATGPVSPAHYYAEFTGVDFTAAKTLDFTGQWTTGWSPTNILVCTQAAITLLD